MGKTFLFQLKIKIKTGHTFIHANLFFQLLVQQMSKQTLHFRTPNKTIIAIKKSLYNKKKSGYKCDTTLKGGDHGNE